MDVPLDDPPLQDVAVQAVIERQARRAVEVGVGACDVHHRAAGHPCGAIVEPHGGRHWRAVGRLHQFGGDDPLNSAGAKHRAVELRNRAARNVGPIVRGDPLSVRAAKEGREQIGFRADAPRVGDHRANAGDGAEVGGLGRLNPARLDRLRIQRFRDRAAAE